MSTNYKTLTNPVLAELVMELPEAYRTQNEIVLTGDETKAQLTAILEQYDASLDPVQDMNQEPTLAQIPVVPLKRIEVAELEDGQFMAGIACTYGDQAGISAELKEQPTQMVRIPLEVGEPKGATMRLNLNGAIFHVTKGKAVALPQSLAEQVDNTYDLDIATIEKFDLGNTVPEQLQ